MSTASGLAENLPRVLVKGMTVMVNRNAKFHQPGPLAVRRLTEDPVVNEPEQGDDVKGDHVADQRVSAFAKWGGEFGG